MLFLSLSVIALGSLVRFQLLFHDYGFDDFAAASLCSGLRVVLLWHCVYLSEILLSPVRSKDLGLG